MPTMTKVSVMYTTKTLQPVKGHSHNAQTCTFLCRCTDTEILISAVIKSLRKLLFPVLSVIKSEKSITKHRSYSPKQNIAQQNDMPSDNGSSMGPYYSASSYEQIL